VVASSYLLKASSTKEKDLFVIFLQSLRRVYEGDADGNCLVPLCGSVLTAEAEVENTLKSFEIAYCTTYRK